MIQNGLISVIVPCYNGKKYIHRFMNAILSQTYKKLEIIFIDDGSTDGSKEEIELFSSAMSENGIVLRVFSQKNQGLGESIQRGLFLVNGEFFSWFGVDDWPEEHYFEKAIEYLRKHQNAGVVRFDGYLVDEHDDKHMLGLFARNNFDKFNEHMFDNAVNEKNFHFGYSVVRTEMFEKANKGRQIYKSREGQNWQILLPVFYYYSAGYIDEPLYYVIEHTDSVSRRADKEYEKKIVQIKEYRTILLETIKKMDIPDKRKYIDQVNERYAHRLFRWAIGNYDYEESLDNYKYLKKISALTKTEKSEYHKRLLQLEYWLYVKHKIFN